MKKNVVTAIGLISLVVLTVVGIAQLGSTKKDLTGGETSADAKKEATGPSYYDQKGERMSVTELPSGLKYSIEKEGTGEATAQPGQAVTVHYTGWLDDNGKIGKKFDSSLDRAQPFTFALGAGHVIKGWDEGVKGMKIGEKRHLIIPGPLGYGAYGAPPRIPGNATLRFDVELIKIG